MTHTPFLLESLGPHSHGATAKVLDHELSWLNQVLEARIKTYMEIKPFSLSEIEPPELPPREQAAPFVALLRHYRMTPPVRLILILALAPVLRPQMLDILFQKNPNTDRGFTEFGGLKGVNHSGFLPTGETALFLLAGDDLRARLKYFPLLHPEHYLFAQRLLSPQPLARGEPPGSFPLCPTSSLLSLLLTGEVQKPDFSGEFPASRIHSDLDWADLVLHATTMDQLEEIRSWTRHVPQLMELANLRRHIKPGFRALFHGPSGTGKTLTACLLGKDAGVDVYRIDLSQIVSKFIGETEKNLANVFDQAKSKNWILFFDEADALFGKRTATATANDRYANQETAYLLQRIEDYPGIIILASNLKSNIDDAFARRFQADIYFAPPDAPQRLQLWKNILNGDLTLEHGIHLQRLAADYVLTGGQIVNVARYAAIKAIDRGDQTMRQADLLRGARRELEKEGRLA